jgi:hypothetical protein
LKEIFRCQQGISTAETLISEKLPPLLSLNKQRIENNTALARRNGIFGIQRDRTRRTTATVHGAVLAGDQPNLLKKLASCHDKRLKLRRDNANSPEYHWTV